MGQRRKGSADSYTLCPHLATESAHIAANIDHDEIRKWVEERGGHPAEVKGTGSKKETGMIRIDFPGYSGEDSLCQISWDDWFQKFDDHNLAFLHQDETQGHESRFNKLVKRDSVDVREHAHSHSKK